MTVPGASWMRDVHDQSNESMYSFAQYNWHGLYAHPKTRSVMLTVIHSTTHKHEAIDKVDEAEEEQELQHFSSVFILRRDQLLDMLEYLCGVKEC